jgi:type VI secretion system protein ImpJ
MSTNQRVVWSEGMLMAPQHLQQLDLYHERLLAARIETLSPYNWGVVAQEIDAGALSKGEFRVASFAGVLPDGHPVTFRAGDAEAPGVRAIESHFPPGQRAPLEVYLGLLKERDGVPSFVEAAQAAGEIPRARFTSITRSIKDMTGGAGSTQVSYGKPNLAVLFGDEPREDFSCIKLCEITRDENGTPVVVETYIPPSLRVSSSPFVMAGLRRILGYMVGKQRELSEQRRQRDASTVEFTPADVTAFLQLAALNSIIPVFNHLGRAGDTSPLQLYLMLSQVAGQLCTFSSQHQPTDLPAFDFANLRGTFEELLAVLTALVRTTIRKEFVEVALEEKRGVLFARFDEDVLKRCGRFVIAVKSDSVSEEQVAKRVESLAKIASWEQIQTVLQAATPGVDIKVTHRPPPEIPIRAGVVYFILNLESTYWKTAMQARNIAIYVPPPFDPSQTKIELMGIPRKDREPG